MRTQSNEVEMRRENRTTYPAKPLGEITLSFCKRTLSCAPVGAHLIQLWLPTKRHSLNLAFGSVLPVLQTVPNWLFSFVDYLDLMFCESKSHFAKIRHIADTRCSISELRKYKSEKNGARRSRNCGLGEERRRKMKTKTGQGRLVSRQKSTIRRINIDEATMKISILPHCRLHNAGRKHNDQYHNCDHCCYQDPHHHHHQR